MLTNKGFTLIEVLIATFVITMGAGGAFALIQRTVTFTTNAGYQLEASYLAQEGMEIVRNIRDTNLLKIHKGVEAIWTDDIIECISPPDPPYPCIKEFEVGYTETSLSSYQGRLLRTTAGFYSYDPDGIKTIYKRKITITQSSADADVLEVLVEVTWEERNQDHKVQAATELYNWLPVTPPSED